MDDTAYAVLLSLPLAGVIGLFFEVVRLHREQREIRHALEGVAKTIGSLVDAARFNGESMETLKGMIERACDAEDSKAGGAS